MYHPHAQHADPQPLHYFALLQGGLKTNVTCTSLLILRTPS